MTRIFTFASLTLGLACLAAGWARAGWWTAAVILLLLIPAVLFLEYRKFTPITGLVLLVVTILAALGLWLRVDLSLALLAVVFTLAAWDLSNFARRLVFAAPADDPARIERDHLVRLNLVLLFGVGLDLLSLSFRHVFGFEWTFILAMLAFYGIGALVAGLKSGTA